MQLSSYCKSHDKHCRIQTAHKHEAVAPCTDASPWGEQRKQLGVTQIYLLAWIGLRLALQECVWWHKKT